MTTGVYDRFMAKVRVDEETGCWLWTGRIHPGNRGYGKTHLNKKTIYVHRLSWELHRGPIPAGLTIDHLCRVRHCVNPDHLEPVTLRDNILRGTSPAAKLNGVTHCLRGHPFDEKNTYWYGPEKRNRMCKACSRARVWARRHPEAVA